MRFGTTLVGALAAALTAAAPAWATFPGANGLIAFSSDRSGDAEIYTMNPDGSDLRRLTNAPGDDGVVRWSPDGRRIVFASSRNGGQADIYVMNADGSEQTRLTTDPGEDLFPAWSPDGGRIAFSSNRDGRGYEIYVMNADGSGQTRITNTALPGTGLQRGSDFPNWSASDRIAFASVTDSLTTFQVFTMAADGSNRTQLTNDPVGALDPNWSPDSARLTFHSERNGDGEVFVMNADGTGVAQLTSAPGDDLAATWSPDGSRILFSSNRDGNTELYTMNPDGSAQARLTNDASTDTAADWQPVVNLPQPKVGETVNVAVQSGTVLIRARGKAAFTKLSQARQIKVGSQLDTTRGVVHLASAVGKGRTQAGDFGRGVFEVTQTRGAKGLTDLKLKGGKFDSCKGSKANAAAKRKAVRSLFSKAKGRFRTRGRYSAATVRGTTWLVEDRCDGTLTTVKSGVVSVRDFKRNKTVTVKAGNSYLARAR